MRSDLGDTGENDYVRLLQDSEDFPIEGDVQKILKLCFPFFSFLCLSENCKKGRNDFF